MHRSVAQHHFNTTAIAIAVMVVLPAIVVPILATRGNPQTVNVPLVPSIPGCLPNSGVCAK